ncbi:MAG: hypothetical protein WC527_06230 [Candidatus Margulisiibacteriota bacterium]
MMDDIHVPKERFLIDYFEKRKSPKETEHEQKRFDDILNKIQLKVDKKDLESLSSMAPAEAEKKIDSLTSDETASIVKETIEKLRSENE